MTTLPSTPRSRRFLLTAGALIAVLALGLLFKSKLWPTTATKEPLPDLPLPPISSSPYLNTGPDAHYIGSDACRTCHADRHASYHPTPMGRSMAEVDLAREPLDATFDHLLSNRRYQVVRRDGQLWHREFLLGDDAKDVLLSEYPVKYVVGSGTHSLSYLVEAEGFLVESPVTWYTTQHAWGVSPGYDVAQSRGFQRPIETDCLYCHAGRAEAIDGSSHRLKIDELAIGCERCHGPGSLHAERHKDKPRSTRKGAGEPDFTIVNPARLSRELSEAICQDCHLSEVAVIANRGRKLTDFRPGLPLEDIKQVYTFDSSDGGMTIVGHVGQMHESRCYRESNNLTCLTCHDPHDEPAEKDRTAYYRSICLGCHQAQDCKVRDSVRHAESPQNDCVHCHMPQAPTEAPHLSYTHHRIGKHEKQPETVHKPQYSGTRLRTFSEPTHLGEADRKRSLGLAWLEEIVHADGPERRAFCMEQTRTFLTEAQAAGLRDPQLEMGLTVSQWELGMSDAATASAEHALGNPDLVGAPRCHTLAVLAEAKLRQGDFQGAIGPAREVTRLRRNTSDWLRVADCERGLGHEAAAIEALNAAVRISPRLWSVHRSLAVYYRKMGDEERAEWHQQRATP